MKILAFIVLLLCMGYVVCVEPPPKSAGASNISFDMSTTMKEPDLFESAMKLDVGQYTPQTFNYFNNQYLVGEGEKDKYRDGCIDEYIRCTLSLSLIKPTCGVNNPWDLKWGYITSLSYCDIYFDNCRREQRVWQTLDYGECKFNYNDHRDDVFHTRKNGNEAPLIVKLLRILATSTGTDVTNQTSTEPHEENGKSTHGISGNDDLADQLLIDLDKYFEDVRFTTGRTDRWADDAEPRTGLDKTSEANENKI